MMIVLRKYLKDVEIVRHHSLAKLNSIERPYKILATLNVDKACVLDCSMSNSELVQKTYESIS